MNTMYSCLIAISMYSRLPVPQVEWTKERMGHVMCFFPIVGAIEGLLLAGWLALACWLGLTPVMTVMWGAALPLLVTGGIHMDGFMDTMDAVCSWGDKEKMLEILKDPHLGAFAVISVIVYMLLYVGVLYEFVAELGEQEARGLAFLLPTAFMVTERVFGGLSVVSFPAAKKDGLAATFAQAANKRTDRMVLFLWLVTVPAFAWLLAGGPGLISVCALEGVQLILFWLYDRVSRMLFGGVTGDLAGCFLQVCELAGWTVAVVLLKTVV